MAKAIKDPAKKADKKSGKKNKKDGKKAQKAAGSQQVKTAAKPSATTTKIKEKVTKLASNPVVAEVVAATLVAAAAAIKDPKKARAMAVAAADELEAAAKGANDRSNVLWQLAMDVARSSVAAFASPAKTSKPDSPSKKAKKNG